jgi:Tol biopolymer transport system component
VTAVDMNYWGVTFGRQDSDRFYATLATGGKTYLIEGSVSGRTARVIHENVECPSLSPDGTRIAYKRRTGVGKRPWQLSVLDLETMRETALAEGRNFDDQAEWLDDDTVMYGLDEQIWVVPADGSGQPRRYIAGADSPAVVRW